MPRPVRSQASLHGPTAPRAQRVLRAGGSRARRALDDHEARVLRDLRAPRWALVLRAAQGALVVQHGVDGPPQRPASLDAERPAAAGGRSARVLDELARV